MRPLPAKPRIAAAHSGEVRGEKPESPCPVLEVLTREGKRIVEMRDAWAKLTAAAGVPGLLRHDLRRSAAKALRAAGVPESVVMAMGGWKTAAMFRRYAIVSSADQEAAVERLEARRLAENSPANSPDGPKSGSAGQMAETRKPS